MGPAKVIALTAGGTYRNDAGATSKMYITVTGGVLLGTGAKEDTFDN